MRIFLCGGGCGQQTVDANKKLNKVIDHNKHIFHLLCQVKDIQAVMNGLKMN